MIANQAGEIPVKLMCRVAEASRSGYYRWKKEPESRRVSENRRLSVEIGAIFEENDETYGNRRIHAELVSRGRVCDRHRVERLMRLDHLRAIQRSKYRRFADDRPQAGSEVPDLLRRNFVVVLPNRVWLADITQFQTREGVLYVALVLDLYSRLIVGWAAGIMKDRWLTTEAFRTAVGWRRPPPMLVNHTDHGGQYACPDYAAALKSAGAVASMSRKGNPYDNSPMESFIKTFKVEFVYRHDFDTRKEAIAGAGEWLQVRYNCRRRHSALGYLSPAEYEKQMRKPS
jgi:Transposase and inactivated derivatives